RDPELTRPSPAAGPAGESAPQGAPSGSARGADGEASEQAAATSLAGPSPCERIDQCARAMAYLVDSAVGPNVAEIARRVGVPRTTLYEWPAFVEALNKAKAQGERARRRYRARKAGGGDFAPPK